MLCGLEVAGPALVSTIRKNRSGTCILLSNTEAAPSSLMGNAWGRCSPSWHHSYERRGASWLNRSTIPPSEIERLWHSAVGLQTEA